MNSTTIIYNSNIIGIIQFTYNLHIIKGVGSGAIACYCCKPYFFCSLSIPETLKNIYIFSQKGLEKVEPQARPRWKYSSGD